MAIKLTYQKYVPHNIWTRKSYFGFHDKHFVHFSHFLMDICTDPSHAVHYFHFMDDNRTTLDAVFTKQWKIVVQMRSVVAC